MRLLPPYRRVGSVVGDDDGALSLLEHKEPIRSGAEFKDDLTSVVVSFLDSLQKLKYRPCVLIVELNLPQEGELLDVIGLDL